MKNERYNDNNFELLCYEIMYWNRKLQREDYIQMNVISDYGMPVYDIQIKNMAGKTFLNDENNDLRSLSYHMRHEYQYLVTNPNRQTITEQDIGKTCLARYMDSDNIEMIQVIDKEVYEGIVYYYIYIIDDDIGDFFRYNEWDIVKQS